MRSGAKAQASLTALLVLGCGATRSQTDTGGIPPDLLRAARPVGTGPKFQPPVRGPVLGRCRPGLGRRFAIHIELFAADRVVLIAAGIGTRPPRRVSAGRITRARCYGDLVTLEPTGLVLIRSGVTLRLSDLFRSWGQPLSPDQVASFTATGSDHVVVFVDGRRRPGSPGGVRLKRHSEIVVEIGPHVPPHPSYTFPPGT